LLKRFAAKLFSFSAKKRFKKVWFVTHYTVTFAARFEKNG
jgi:hypothetical protein